MWQSSRTEQNRLEAGDFMKKYALIKVELCAHKIFPAEQFVEISL